MKKIIFALALLATLFLGACEQEEEKVLQIWAWNKSVDVLEDAVIRYQEINPDFKAEIVDFGKRDINTKISASASLNDSSDMADVILGDWIYMRSNKELFPELFANLGDYITEDELNAFPNFAVDVVRDENDDVFALPFGIGPTVTFVNTKLMNEVGITNAQIEDIQLNGWTWDEYIEIGMALQEINEEYYMSAYNLSADDRLFRTMVSQDGYWFMDENQNVTVDNDSSEQALEQLKYMYDNNIVKHVDSGDYKSLMVEGKIAAQIQGFWLSGQIKSLAEDQSGDWRILPCPSASSDTTGASITGGSYLYVNNQSELKEEAIAFIIWQTTEAVNSLRTLEVGGIFPVLSEVYGMDEFASTDDFFGSHNYLSDVARNVNEAKPIYPSEYNGFNYDTYIQTQYYVLFEDNNVLDELMSAASKMRENKSE